MVSRDINSTSLPELRHLYIPLDSMGLVSHFFRSATIVHSSHALWIGSRIDDDMYLKDIRRKVQVLSTTATPVTSQLYFKGQLLT